MRLFLRSYKAFQAQCAKSTLARNNAGAGTVARPSELHRKENHAMMPEGEPGEGPMAKNYFCL